MFVVTEFLAGLQLPCLVHLGFAFGVSFPLPFGSCGWPQKESLPMLQSFGGTRTPADVFGLALSGVHMSFMDSMDMAGMAGSAPWGPAVRELHFTLGISQLDGLIPFRLACSFLASLSAVQLLSISGKEVSHLGAEAINALPFLQELALRDVVIHGFLTGPCLTQIVCLTPRTQLRLVLARPPPALTSVLVPLERMETVVPRSVLGVDVPRETEAVRACPAGPRWVVSQEACQGLWDWHSIVPMNGLVRAVRCRD